MIEEFVGYMKEVKDVGWVPEIISERFDNALDFMSPASVVYGGAVRDALAKKPLEGDLDFAVTEGAFRVMSDQFLENPRWIAVNESGDITAPESMGSGKIARDLAPMNGVYQFKNMDDRIVQLVTSRQQFKDELQTAIYPARQVDIICCGVVMLRDGRVFEVLPGAYQDCVEGVLRINENSETMFLDTLESRIEKLVKRGWRSEINVAAVIKDVKRQRARQNKARRKARPAQASSPTSIFERVESFSIVPPNARGMGVITNDSGGYSRVIDFACDDAVNAIQLIAHNRQIACLIKRSPLGRTYLVTDNRSLWYEITDHIKKATQKAMPHKVDKSWGYKDMPEPKVGVSKAAAEPKRAVHKGGFVTPKFSEKFFEKNPEGDEVVESEKKSEIDWPEEVSYQELADSGKKGKGVAESLLHGLEPLAITAKMAYRAPVMVTDLIDELQALLQQRPTESNVKINFGGDKVGTEFTASVPQRFAYRMAEIWNNIPTDTQAEIIVMLRRGGHLE